MVYSAKPMVKKVSAEKLPYRNHLTTHYIVEYRPARFGEQYLFTQKNLFTHDQAQGPAVLKSDDHKVPFNIRPVVVGEINPELGTVIYYADQED